MFITDNKNPGCLPAGARFALDPADDADADGAELAALMASRELAACLLEIGDGSPRQCRLLAASRAFDTVPGLQEALADSLNLELCGRVALTGEPASFESRPGLEHRVRAHAFRIGDADRRQVVVLFENCGPSPAPDADAVLQRFGAMLAHELRAPLAPLKNGVHILKRLAQGNEAMQSPLTMMERQLGRLVSLVDDLLDVGRLGTAKVRIEHEPVNLQQVISESIESCEAAIGARHHEVKMESDGTELVVRGDPRRLQQVFTNLLSNSIKFTDAGGHIRILLRRAEDLAVIDVCDDGAGIAAEELPHIFDLFSQGELHRYDRDGGLGIGLSIVRTVIRLHGGTVSARSEGLGRGAVFTVRLPLHV
jgi:signal transduction histidine kinase